MWRAVFISVLAVAPSSTNYTLNSYDFGNGGNTSNSTNYTLRAAAGSNGGTLSSSSYTLPPGVVASTTVATPAAPSFVNPDTSYTRLQLTINPGTAPSDTKFAVAISTDNFSTTQYVKADQTVGSTLTLSDYQTYSAWGGASGVWVVGLASNTTYQVKAAALQGSSTGSGFGPVAAASTSVPSVSFGVTTSLTATPPFTASFASLPASSVVNANATLNANITSNAAQGGEVLIKGQNGGLTSSRAAHTIVSASADLTAASSGYGAQVSSNGQASGGPIVAKSPFNGTSNTVGALTTSWQQLATFNAPVTGGAVSVGLLAKANAQVPSAPDYSDVLTITISLLF